MGKNKVFIFLLYILILLTTLSFFFVKFSVDGNRAILNALPSLNAGQIQYGNALSSNNSLAYIFFLSMTGLTCFVFVMFFYRFFRTEKIQLGCLKALGFRDMAIRSYFIVFTAALSLIGSLSGLLSGYLISDVLINANIRSYGVTGLIKAISPVSLAVGCAGSAAAFCVTAFLSYAFIRGKEPGRLIQGDKTSGAVKTTLLTADRIVNRIPVKNKLSLRIALRKPLAVLLILTAVMSFNVCIILGQSLLLSNQQIYASQTQGHAYEFDTRYDAVKTTDTAETGSAAITEGELPYLHDTAKLTVSGHSLEETVIGLYQGNGLYELQNTEGTPLPVPDADGIYINPGLADTYRVRIGDTLTLTIAGREYDFTVAGIASNAHLKTIYMNAGQLSERLDIPDGSYNGLWSMERPSDGGNSTDRARRMDTLEQNTSSNKTSSVINQVTGGVIGCILIFLALLVNFQDNLRDMQILKLLGYKAREIQRLLINIYRPIMWAAFLLTVIPSIFTAQSIQRSLSITTGDYMPFGISIAVLLILFAVLNILYLLVQLLFLAGIRTAKKERAHHL